MRILLVNPRHQPSFWTLDGAAPITQRPGLMTNLALATIAALTPDDIEVEVVDESVQPLDLDTPCDVVGSPGTSPSGTGSSSWPPAFRERGRLVLIGGPHASLAPETYRPYADVLFVGEAEETWPQFVADHATGTWADTYEGDRIDITQSPVPRHDLVEFGRFHMGSVQTSRGCPFECEFCDVIIYLGRRQRHKTPDQVVAELEALYAARLPADLPVRRQLHRLTGAESARILEPSPSGTTPSPSPCSFTPSSRSTSPATTTRRCSTAAPRPASARLRRHRDADPEALTRRRSDQNVRRDLVDTSAPPIARHRRAGGDDRRLRLRHAPTCSNGSTTSCRRPAPR